MRRIGPFNRVLALGLLVLSQPGFGQDRAFINPEVVQRFATESEGSFFILLREKADLEPAFRISDWEERGSFVVERLKQVADTSQAGLRDLLAARGAEFKTYWIVNTILVTTDDAALISQLAARPEVAEIRAPATAEIPELEPGEEQPRVENIEWNVDRIGAPLVWAAGVTGERIVVANVDTGVQFDHPALVNQYRGNLGGGIFDHNYNWFDPSNVCGTPSTVPCDNHWHGTSTMGFMVGDDGGANQIGVAPGAKWIAAKGCEATEIGCSLEALLSSGEWILEPRDLDGQNPRVDLRPHVVNTSASYGRGDPFYLATVQAWVAAGIFPAIWMGNYGPACSTSVSAGEYEESYAAGAFDFNNDIWDGSSRGPSAFGPIKPNITAPGRGVRTCRPIDTYVTGSGTSWATPHVAGTVALIWSGWPSLIRDVAPTRSLLDQSAIDVSDLSCGGDPGNNNVWGEGRLDAFAAFQAAAVVFADGFESGDTSAWSSTVP